jgi:nucleoside-diphosphate-sugar epimerase
MKDKITVLLTGSTGFLGSHIIQRFLLENDINLIALKRSSSNLDRLRKMVDLSFVQFYDCDIIDVEDIFKKNRIDVVIHTATEYGRGDKTIYDVLNANLMFPIRIAELSIKYNVNTFINTDSYFNKESLSYNYLLNYSLSKKSLISWLKRLSGQLKVINIVLEHVYGAFDNSPKFVENAIQNIGIKKVNEFDTTHGHQKRDFIFINDVVDAFLVLMRDALTKEFHYKNIELGTGKSIEIREFINIVKSFSNSPTVINFGRIPYRSDEIMDSKADIQELINLGWKPRYSVEDGIKTVLDIYNNKTDK